MNKTYTIYCLEKDGELYPGYVERYARDVWKFTCWNLSMTRKELKERGYDVVKCIMKKEKTTRESE
jgi:hypothetical protein